MNVNRTVDDFSTNESMYSVAFSQKDNIVISVHESFRKQEEEVDFESRENELDIRIERFQRCVR